MSDTSLRTQVYDLLRQALTMGRFAPGQKLTFRFIAGALGVSLTPVREALGRLVAEGAFEMQPNRSVRVPLMTRARIVELRDIRIVARGVGRVQGGRRPPTSGRSPNCAALRSPSPRPAAAATARPTARTSASSISALRHRRAADLAAGHRRALAADRPLHEPALPRFHQPAAGTADAGAHHPRPAGPRCGCSTPGNRERYRSSLVLYRRSRG